MTPFLASFTPLLNVPVRVVPALECTTGAPTQPWLAKFSSIVHPVQVETLIFSAHQPEAGIECEKSSIKRCEGLLTGNTNTATHWGAQRWAKWCPSETLPSHLVTVRGYGDGVGLAAHV